MPDLGGDRLGREISVDAPVPDGAEGSGHKTPEIGLYCGRRFFAATGCHVEGKPLELQDITAAVHALAAEMSGASKRKANETRQGASTPNEPGEAPPPPPEDLPSWLISVLAADPALDGSWRSGTKPGRGKDHSRSGLEFSLAIRLRQLGRAEADIAEALRLFPHGTVRNLSRGVAERRIARVLEALTTLEEGKFLDLTHDGLALELGEQWSDSARFVALWGEWLGWDGQRWLADKKLLHMTHCRDFLRGKAEELLAWAEEKGNLIVAKAKVKADDTEGERAVKLVAKAEGERDKLAAWAEAAGKPLRSAPFINSVVTLARSNVELVGTVDQWDRDPLLLGTPADTVDLRSGRLRSARREDFIAKQTAVVPANEGTVAPIWTAFLERIFVHAPEVIPLMQRVARYALTGSTVEHVLLFACGQGGNGKGVLMNTLTRVMGEYTAVAPGDLLLVTQADRHPTDLAMLHGARLVTASELAPGRAWDESKLKSLTGGDPITARFMRQDFFTYEPGFTLFVAGNHKPSFKGVDEAIRRRVLLIPFLQNIPAEERDKNLPEKLKAEWPAILRWAIDGALQWQAVGLDPPDVVRVASDEYFAAEDVLGQWIDERCILSPSIDFTGTSQLFASWKSWAEEAGTLAGSMKAFSQRLAERGFAWKQRKTGNGFVGIRLAEVHPGADFSAGGGYFYRRTETVF